MLRARRTSGRWSVAAACGVVLFGSSMTTLLSLGHLGGVLAVELRRTPIVYDFRFYSLLIGVLNTLLGLQSALVTRRLAEGERDAAAVATRAMIGLLLGTPGRSRFLPMARL